MRPVAHSTWGVRGFRSADPECGGAVLRRLCARWLACVRPAASRVTHAAVCSGVNLGPRECASQARSQVRYEYSDTPRACDAYVHRSDGLRGTSSVCDGPPRRPPPRPAPVERLDDSPRRSRPASPGALSVASLPCRQTCGRRHAGECEVVRGCLLAVSVPPR